MKWNRLLPAAAALVLSVSLAACTGKPPAPTDTASPVPTPQTSAAPTPTPEPTPTPAVEAAPPLWGNQVLTREFTAGDGTVVMTVTYKLPMVQNTDTCPAGLAINNWYKAEGNERMAFAEEDYEMAVADYDVSAASGLHFTPTTQEMSYTVQRQDERVISVSREWYVNSGGAYPNVFRLSEQFDARTGAQMGFADFFSDPDAVMKRVLDAFMGDETVAGAALERDAVSAAIQPENFYLTDQGYVFWIQGNALAGIHTPLEVTLTYDALEDLTTNG